MIEHAGFARIADAGQGHAGLLSHRSDQTDGRCEAWSASCAPWEGRDRGWANISGRIGHFLAVQDREREYLFDDVTDVDSGRRCSSVLHFPAECSEVFRCDLLEEPVFPGRRNVARAVGHPCFLEPALPELAEALCSFSRRFCRCFSWAGEMPSPTMRRASRHNSLARASVMPSGPYCPSVTVSRRPFIR